MTAHFAMPYLPCSRWLADKVGGQLDLGGGQNLGELDV